MPMSREYRQASSSTRIPSQDLTARARLRQPEINTAALPINMIAPAAPISIGTCSQPPSIVAAAESKPAKARICAPVMGRSSSTLFHAGNTATPSQDLPAHHGAPDDEQCRTTE